MTVEQIKDFTNPAEVTLAKMPFRRRSDRDKRICACGHPFAFHTAEMEVPGRKIPAKCNTTRLECACTEPREVALVQDPRKFLRVIVGTGEFDHPLTVSMLASHRDDKDVLWTVPQVCDFCGNGPAWMHGITNTGRLATKTSEATYHKFLCSTHRAKLQGNV